MSSWREKIARDVAGASWGNGSGEEEEEEDGPAVLVEQQTDSAMEPTGPSRERYKDGVVTIGCVGKDSEACRNGLLLMQFQCSWASVGSMGSVFSRTELCCWSWELKGTNCSGGRSAEPLGAQCFLGIALSDQ